MALLAHFKDKITLEESCPIKKHIVPSTNSQLDIHPSCKFSLGRKAMWSETRMDLEAHHL